MKSASNGIPNCKTYSFKKTNSGTIDQFLLLVLEGHFQQTPHNFKGRSSWNHSILPAYFSILTILLNIAWTLSGQYFGGRRKSRYHIDCACVSLYICHMRMLSLRPNIDQFMPTCLRVHSHYRNRAITDRHRVTPRITSSYGAS